MEEEIEWEEERGREKEGEIKFYGRQASFLRFFASVGEVRRERTNP